MTRDAATEAQNRAARPDASTWVAANAGSGKTRVLTDRVARLLLRGTDPASILCLTYTKAAASEMQNRLFRRLGEWTMMADGALNDALAALGEDTGPLDPLRLVAARRLFARALETPGGLKIQTIHAFCEQLLRRFPLEAGVSPQFEIMEDRQAAQIRKDILEAIAAAPEGPFAALAPHVTGQEQDFDKFLAALAKQADAFLSPFDSDTAAARLGVRPIPDAAAILSAVPAGVLGPLEAALAASGKPTDAALAAGLSTLRAKGDAGISDAEDALLTGKGEVRKSMATNAVLAIRPDAREHLVALAEALLDRRAALAARDAFDQARALHAFAGAFVRAFAARKQFLGRLDFDDLIVGARRLLTEADERDWVKFKLDGGIDHILVDEAQDTSPAQWEVISALAAEFFAGQGARNTRRTLFVVGDEKQSIYSFQGADPQIFGQKRDAYAAALADVADTLELCELNFSFRSAAPVLDAVDAVLAATDTHGLGDDIRHAAFHSDKPGRVELWPFLEKEKGGEEAPWYLPVDQPEPTDPQLRLAAQVAERIDALLKAGVRLPGTDRAIGPGDFLILVRSRGKLFHATLRELKARNLPVSGADRLIVTEQLAVKDLLALLAVIATPSDDLSLAAALRSPVFGLTEGDLFALAHGRSGTLWQALEAARDRFGDANALMDRLRRQADYLRPHEMLELILTGHGARERIRARLGSEAEDAVEALLDLALDYETVEPPTLTGFLDWMGGSDPEVKRELGQAKGEIRVMTVHGAKGLEAPVVILPDTAQKDDRPTGAMLADLGGGLVTLRAAKGGQTPLHAAEEADRVARDRRENWRLLYVAMTRAETWLIVCGAGENKGEPEKCWYEAVRRGLAAIPAVEDADGMLSVSRDWVLEPAAAAAAGPIAAPAVPAWAHDRVPPVPKPEPPLAPSRDGAGAWQPDPDEPAALLTPDAALRRGRQVHRLLEVLPDLSPETRAAAVPGILSALGDPADPAEAAALLAEVGRLIEDPELAWIFAPGSMAEVPVAGHVAALGGRALRGQIDRLVVTPQAVWAVDYKSDTDPPPAGGPLPPAYAGQLALYHAALSQIWPERPIRAAILWTATGTVTEIPHDAVKDDLSPFTAH